MLLTPHTAVGVVIGSRVGNPFIAVPLALISHFIMDRIPHWDFFTFTRKKDRLRGRILYGILIDFGLGLIVGMSFVLYSIWVEKNLLKAGTIFFSAAASNLPDAISSPIVFLGKNNKFIKIMSDFQSWNQAHATPFWGISIQILILLICSLLLLG